MLIDLGRDKQVSRLLSRLEHDPPEAGCVCADGTWGSFAPLLAVHVARRLGRPILFISPHIGGNVPSYFALVQDLFLRNLAHYVRGERMECVVNKQRGY